MRPGCSSKGSGSSSSSSGPPRASGPRAPLVPRPRVSAACSAACSATSAAASSAGCSTRPLGVVERRVDRRSPARFLAGTLGAIAGSALALVLVLPVALLVPVPFAVSLVGLASWIFGYVGFRVVARQSEAVLELLGLSTRPLVRAQAFDARDGLLVDSSVVMDGQLLPLTRGRRAQRRPDGGALRARRGAGLRRRDRRREAAARPARTRDARLVAPGRRTCACSCSTTRCPRSPRSTPS